MLKIKVSADSFALREEIDKDGIVESGKTYNDISETFNYSQDAITCETVNYRRIHNVDEGRALFQSINIPDELRSIIQKVIKSTYNGINIVDDTATRVYFNIPELDKDSVLEFISYYNPSMKDKLQTVIDKITKISLIGLTLGEHPSTKVYVEGLTFDEAYELLL